MPTGIKSGISKIILDWTLATPAIIPIIPTKAFESNSKFILFFKLEPKNHNKARM